MTSSRVRAAWWWRVAVVAAYVLGTGVIAPSWLSAQQTVRIDGLAAVVGGDAPGAGVEVVLHSDVQLRARIKLAGQSEERLPLGTLPASLLEATLQEIIGELLIEREARRVQVAVPSEAEVRYERERLARAAGGKGRLRALLDALAAEEDELDVVARRRALVAAFLRANLEGVTTVTQAELERATATQGSEQGAAVTLNDEELEQLRAQLARDALERAVQRWVVVLRSRIPTRVYVP